MTTPPDGSEPPRHGAEARLSNEVKPEVSGSMELFKGLLRALAWLTGSLAGVAAALYCVGYLVLSGHLAALGLTGLVSLEHDQVIQHGGRFLLRVGQDLAEPLLAVVAVVVLVIIVVRLLLALAPLKRAVDFVAAKGRQWLTWLSDQQRQLLAYLMAFLLLLAHADAYLQDYSKPLKVNNLLYTAIPDCGAQAKTLSDAILLGDPSGVRFFDNQVFGIFLSVLILCLGLRVTRAMKQRFLLMTPFALASSLHFIMVAMAYGILIQPASYPNVVLRVDADAPTPPGPLYLLNRTNEGFLLWAKSAKHVVWMPARTVSRIDTIATNSLFCPPRS